MRIFSQSMTRFRHLFANHDTWFEFKKEPVFRGIAREFCDDTLKEFQREIHLVIRG